MHFTHRTQHNQVGPPMGEIGGDLCDEASQLAVGPDDMPLEIDDLATHFLFEATQAAPSSRPPPLASGLESEALEASLGEACFEGQEGRAGQRAFERLWREIISRELASTAQ